MAQTLQLLSSLNCYHHYSPLIKPTKKFTTVIKSQQNNETSSSSGIGFGSTETKKQSNNEKKKATKTESGERRRVIRRAPAVEKAEAAARRFVSEEEKAKAQESAKNESAFLLTWLGLGVVILLQGIALAASGFLPEEWDNFFVKYLYPSFTPTVALFVAGTVIYGVSKYLQNESLRSDK